MRALGREPQLGLVVDGVETDVACVRLTQQVWVQVVVRQLRDDLRIELVAYVGREGSRSV